MKIGIVIGRFQLDQPHAGHKQVLDWARTLSDRVIVFAGTGVVRSPKNPLKYQQVKQGIEQISGTYMLSKGLLKIFKLEDNTSDKVWVDNLLETVRGMTQDSDEITYFGSRDSKTLELLAKRKQNIHKVEELYNISATEWRKKIPYTSDPLFRAGYIKAVQDVFPSHGAVADALIVADDHILLGYKGKHDQWGLIGGFCDPEDKDIGDTCIREALEETGLTVTKKALSYVGTAQCDSWEYRDHLSPFTTAFRIDYKESMGVPTAGDDIDELDWVKLEDAVKMDLPKHHKMLIKKLIPKKPKK